ncbi:sodium/potassium-transporting ATPase subunit gamma [Siphateles boraxobius]|uniref:sodium/potassium-transporting ATPase subunit gamma n=1 Tax=Siphateles boraxobius TaxID=180520 RepID=UPI004063B088
MGVEKNEYSDADFTYDYELIRRGGLIFAAVLFCLGMAIIFSKKLKCGNKSSAK